MSAAVNAPAGAPRQVPWRRAVVTLAALGATLGTVFDTAHVLTGAITYPVSSPLGFPLWVPLLYAAAALAIGLSHPLLDRALGRPARPPLSFARVAAGLAALCVIWFCTGALPFGSLGTTLIVGPAALAVFGVLDRTRAGLLLAASTAVTSVGVEVLLSQLGLFAHTHRDVFGVALWLPCIYVAASVAVGNTGRWLLAPPAVAPPTRP